MKKPRTLIATLLVATAGVTAYAMTASASVNLGRHVEVGCATQYDVLVFTVVDNNGRPTGPVAARPYACSGSPDLQPYVTVRADNTFGDIIVRNFPNRLHNGTPIGLDVVDQSPS